MMRFIVVLLAVTAVLAQETPDHTLEIMDEFLETETETEMPCIPKTCMPVCKLVTKYVTYGAYKLPYQENVCAPDTKCLAEKAACIAKLNAAMKAAEAAEKDMIAKAKLANSAKATKAQKDAAAAAKKKEEAAAAGALAAAKAAFEVAEKEAAAANAAQVSAASASKNKNAEMAKALAKYEATKKLHLEAQAAYAGAKSAAAKAAADYAAAVKAHCDAEAKHAEAVKYIGHPQHEVKTCRNGQATASYSKIMGWPSDYGSLMGPHKSPCNLAEFKKSLKSGQGYYWDPYHGKGWCRKVDAAKVNGIYSAKQTGKWTGNGRGATFLPPATAVWAKHSKIMGWPTDYGSLMGPHKSPCNLVEFKKSLKSGQGYYWDPYNGKGWCRKVDAAKVNGIYSAKQAGKWTGNGRGATFLPPATALKRG